MKRIITVAVATTLVITITKAEDPWIASPLCPFQSTDLVRFPYEGDCSKFWECYNGARYSMDCPHGLEFNAAASRCDRPELTSCDPAPNEDLGPLPECPFLSDELVFFPVVNNCSKYWECFQGNRYLMTCPEGLYWNTLVDYCDYAENVDCSRDNKTTAPISTTTEIPDTTTTSGGFTPDPGCPYPSDKMTFLPHPECNKFYQCYQGKKFVMTCPIGLYWKQDQLACVTKAEAECYPVSTTTDLPDTSTVLTTTDLPITTTTISPTCENQPDGTYLPHPTDCSKFYECVGGKTIVEQCSGDLLWNQEAHTCDYPENVDCSTSEIEFG